MIRRLIRAVVGRPATKDRRKDTTDTDGVRAQAEAPLVAEPDEEVAEEEPELEVDAEQALAWVGDGRKVTWLDIREPYEVAQGYLEGAILVPMNSVPDQLAALPSGQTIVVYCAAGVRSYGVSHWLREQGFVDSWSLIGGGGAAASRGMTWVSPPADAAFAPLQPVRVSAEALARLEIEGGVNGSTVQDVRETTDGLVYGVLLTLQDGASMRVEGLTEEDLEGVGMGKRR